MSTPNLSPTEIAQHSPTEMVLAWNTGERFTIPFLELRFLCPCAACVDENSGKRTLKKESLKPDVKPKDVQLVGRYAVQITWSDGHNTGMYHYENLHMICERFGKKI